MLCDVTLPSKPVQVDANGCLLIHVAEDETGASLLRSCNLRSLLLISTIIAKRTVTAEAAGSSPVVPAILFNGL